MPFSPGFNLSNALDLVTLSAQSLRDRPYFPCPQAGQRYSGLPKFLLCKKNQDKTNCGDIQPAVGKLFPRFEKGDQRTLGIGLAIGAIIILVSLYLRVLPSSVSIEAWLASLGLAGGALACAFWEPLAQFLTEHGNREPIALLQGR